MVESEREEAAVMSQTKADTKDLEDLKDLLDREPSEETGYGIIEAVVKRIEDNQDDAKSETESEVARHKSTQTRKCLRRNSKRSWSTRKTVIESEDGSRRRSTKTIFGRRNRRHEVEAQDISAGNPEVIGSKRTILFKEYPKKKEKTLFEGQKLKLRERGELLTAEGSEADYQEAEEEHQEIPVEIETPEEELPHSRQEEADDMGTEVGIRQDIHRTQEREPDPAKISEMWRQYQGARSGMEYRRKREIQEGAHSSDKKEYVAAMLRTFHKENDPDDSRTARTKEIKS
ncbi:hypothetical protein B0H14DRAFT_3178028 [Mycena olivaceomarginata]|nr:hypothetical protein B0H14DRAFT_3178028 [Mycena olivaceomarginata]